MCRYCGCRAVPLSRDYIAEHYHVLNLLDGVLLVSWPAAGSPTAGGTGMHRPGLRRGATDLRTHQAELPS
jgi:hypothetical protein